MSVLDLPARPAGALTLLGGVAIAGLGLSGAADPDVGSPWLLAAGLAAELLVAGVLALRRAATGIRTARPALAVAAVALALFGLAHGFALVDPDRAVPLFTAFLLAVSAGLIVAGGPLARARLWHGPRRFVPLLCGIWPVATIPAGSALGDLTHFLAIAGWGLCWTALGAVLISDTSSARPATHDVEKR